MRIEARLNSIISKLQDARDDAQKIDSGRAGEPGTRLRKLAMDLKKDLGTLRDEITEARDEAKAAKAATK